jgi:hypothetical protein
VAGGAELGEPGAVGAVDRADVHGDPAGQVTVC